ncbi:hypothetical protein L486_06417 [Kwoniella mangroviensis CBS 10435]|uniref:Uncharacterized protein n=1 Tax=Kwoniella mangroviensis CBS 10435 TaxID=1331196 RepID=A0A1B9IJ49_9TREE|nr:hypothetical protein L486_06417 [Kwoniella mangroviensis CBS 10435]
MSVEQFLNDIRSFPKDIGSLTTPDLLDVDADQLTHGLLEILQETDTLSSRHAVLQAAALLPPHAFWSDIALKWVEEQDGTSPGTARIVEYIGSALAHEAFPSYSWLKALEDDSRSHVTLKRILVIWSGLNFDSLMLDTGNQLFSINLRLLLAILPYAPLMLTPKVPLLAIVLGRAISWRDRPFIDHTLPPRDGFTRTELPEPSLDWLVAQSAVEMDLELPEHMKPRRIAQLFIIAMYGAWPSNVIAFVRDPASYIRGKNVTPIYAVDWEMIWTPGVLATRLEPLIRDFRLHPSLVVFTSTAELADEKRWERIDAAEFIARSQALSNSDQQGFTGAGLFEQDEQSAPPQVDSASANLSNRLAKENELLRLEAKFTSRVRRQYLYHIGRLHKTSLRLNNDEAEIHSFVNRLKAQAGQIAELTAQLSQTRTEASQAQQKHVKWQGQLREKVASFREEKATWQTEAARIRAELSEARAMVKTQREELAEVKNERFKLQNRLTEAEPKIRHISDYETRMKQLTESQRLWDEDVQRCKNALQEAEAAKARVYELEQMLRASRQETIEQSQAIGVLESKIPTTHQVKAEELDTSSAPTPTAAPKDLDVYIALLEQAKKRTDELERENLLLRDNLSGAKQDTRIVDGEMDKSFMFGQ